MKELTSIDELGKEFEKTLKKLGKTLNGPYVTNVGVLGSKANRPNDNAIDNAGLGLVHEFGSMKKNIPQRSWLRMPIMHKSKDILKAVAGKQRTLAEALTREDGKIIFQILGLACESAIQEAFDSSGFGTWPQKKSAIDEQGHLLSKSDQNNPSPLIDTGEFRQSVTSNVERKTS